MAKWQFPEDAEERWKEWKRRGMLLTVGIGISGLVALLVGLKGPDISWETLSIGEKLGVVIYLVAVGGGFVVWALANWKVKAMRDKMANRTERSS